MNIRMALLKTADHIARHPGEFNFDAVTIPDSPGCGTPGCAIGWLGHFAKCYSFDQVAKALGIPKSDVTEFYIRMDEMSGGGRPYSELDNYIPGKWRKRAAVCAETLRAYADKYHPAEKRGIPDNVRAIFTTPQSEPAPATAAEIMALHDRTIAALKSA